MKAIFKKQIFNTLLDIKFHYYTLSLLSEKYYKYDRNVNIFLTLASSGSIAAWAIWDRFTWLWGLIIATSQVINLLKPYFQYSKYSKEFSQKSLLLQGLINSYEKFYFKIHRNKLDEDIAAESFFDFKQEIDKILNFTDEIVFDINPKMKVKANYKMKVYLKKNFNINLNESQKISKND
ncbi:hypothetical protein [Labilibaculum manganireducens]|uniref:hypothetical protein n=1 Tax=Labilibaculum manganireducens TaxID=1940525 RepID=UPI0029F50615|nr:hypothetical protein [Labilibaculum manganireducens]